MLHKSLVLALISIFAVSCSSKAQRNQAEDYFQQPVAAEVIPANTVVNFGFDNFELSKKAMKLLSENFIPQLKADPKVKVVVEGHCDERGSNKYNKKLGKNRANAVKKFLLKNGVEESRIRAISFGKSMPLDPAHNEDAWAKNRRAVTIYAGY